MAEADPTEEWRVVARDFAYEVSNLGRVRRAARSRFGPAVIGYILKPQLDDRGRPRVTLTNRKKTRICSLVCEAFHGLAPSPKHEVAHWDGNNQHNHESNLRWATRKENAEDMVRHGRSIRGLFSKLTKEDVIAIFGLLARGISQQKIADQFNVYRTSIQCISDGRSYAYLRLA